MGGLKGVPTRGAKAWRLAIDETRSVTQKNITVAGAGIIGLWQALTLAKAGNRVRLMEASAEPFAASSSRWAAAMIAPECEAEAAPKIVRDMGRRGLALWRAAYSGLIENGTLVVAAARDRAELTRFQRMTDITSCCMRAGWRRLSQSLATASMRRCTLPTKPTWMPAQRWLFCCQQCARRVSKSCSARHGRGTMATCWSIAGEWRLATT